MATKKVVATTNAIVVRANDSGRILLGDGLVGCEAGWGLPRRNRRNDAKSHLMRMVVCLQRIGLIALDNIHRLFWADLVLVSAQYSTNTSLAFVLGGGTRRTQRELTASFLASAVFFLITVDLCFGDGVAVTATPANRSDVNCRAIFFGCTGLAVSCRCHRRRRTRRPQQSSHTQHTQRYPFHRQLSFCTDHKPLLLGVSFLVEEGKCC